MKKNVYKIGCIAGWGSILAAFFINLGFINLLGLGFFILGFTFFHDFYFNNGKFDLVNCWWQDVCGFYCLAIGLYYQFGFSKFKMGLVLTTLFIVSLIVKYTYTKIKLKERNKSNNSGDTRLNSR